MTTPRPLVCDEIFDRLVSRPLAGAVVAVVRHTPITPNMLTGVATLFGLASGWFLGQGEGLIAACVLIAYLVFDCTDGQLARLRGGGGHLGRIVDGLGDYVSAVAIHIGLVAWLWQLHGPWIGIGAGLAAGWAITWHSAELDRHKRRYNGTTDDIEGIRKQSETAPPVQAWILRNFIPYAEKLNKGAVVEDLPAYQVAARPALRLWLLQGPTWHFTTMAACVAFEQPLLYCGLAVVPYSVIALWAKALQRPADRYVRMPESAPSSGAE